MAEIFQRPKYEVSKGVAVGAFTLTEIANFIQTGHEVLVIEKILYDTQQKGLQKTSAPMVGSGFAITAENLNTFQGKVQELVVVVTSPGVEIKPAILADALDTWSNKRTEREAMKLRDAVGQTVAFFTILANRLIDGRKEEGEGVSKEEVEEIVSRSRIAVDFLKRVATVAIKDLFDLRGEIFGKMKDITPPDSKEAITALADAMGLVRWSLKFDLALSCFEEKTEKGLSYLKGYDLKPFGVDIKLAGAS